MEESPIKRGGKGKIEGEKERVREGEREREREGERERERPVSDVIHQATRSAGQHGDFAFVDRH